MIFPYFHFSHVVLICQEKSKNEFFIIIIFLNRLLKIYKYVNIKYIYKKSSVEKKRLNVKKFCKFDNKKFLL